MQNAMFHRGPDGEGAYFDENMGIAMRRLSIIDVAHGAQPLFDEHKAVALVANGEIYNAPELREGLEKRGHHFATGSDCEVIAHLYEESGIDCVQVLRGMYAFALWDTKLKRLILARDRMGEKPLYLYEFDGGLIFASEMKALLSSGLVPFELDPAGVDLFFHYQYVPEPFTAVRGVRKLEAATVLTVDVAPWWKSERTYWRMEEAPPLTGDPVELIRARLDEVGRLIVRSDVPVGVALSGGLDSSAIAALAANKYPGTIHAFSVGYPGRPECDERADAKRLANHIGLPFHDVELRMDEMVDAFPELNSWRDDPIADISGYGYYRVMKLAKDHHVPVVLQGQGGDELFWGYDWVRRAVGESRRKQLLQQFGPVALMCYLRTCLPEGLRPWQLRLWAEAGFGMGKGFRDYKRDRISTPEQLVFYDLLADFREAASGVNDLYTGTFKDQLEPGLVGRPFSKKLPWQNIEVALTRMITDTYLRENGVVQGDRLSMASSVELRLPLLDHVLVETVVGLRKTYSDSRSDPKLWLRSAVAPLLPDWVRSRKKRGFTPPLRDWHDAIFKVHGINLQGGFLVDSKVLSEESALMLSKGYFTPGAVAPLSFKALVLETWCREMRHNMPAN
jgi:asparagine synthase (glutamine-hydrolysing)